MKCTKPTVCIPLDIFEVSVARALEAGYQSWSSYVACLVRHDLQYTPDHSERLKIAQAHPDKRDAIDKEIAETARQRFGSRTSIQSSPR